MKYVRNHEFGLVQKETQYMISPVFHVQNPKNGHIPFFSDMAPSFEDKADTVHTC